MQRSIMARSKASAVDLLGIISGRDLFDNFLRAKGRAVLPHCATAPLRLAQYACSGSFAFGARKLPEFGPRNAAADGQDQQLATCDTRQLGSGIDRAISADRVVGCHNDALHCPASLAMINVSQVCTEGEITRHRQAPAGRPASVVAIGLVSPRAHTSRASAWEQRETAIRPAAPLRTKTSLQVRNRIDYESRAGDRQLKK
jgi:hypothetical protein